MTSPVPPIVQHRLCAREGCPNRYDPHSAEHGGWVPARFCSAECHKASKPVPEPKPRAKLRPSVTKPPRRPISAASKEQTAKRNSGASIVSGATEGLDMAHICPRSMGGCDHPDCVVPLTREEHRRLDNPASNEEPLDLLPYLIDGERHEEMCHALWHYRLDLVALLERVTNTKWQPVEKRRAA